jgi:hypothetical protein
MRRALPFSLLLLLAACAGGGTRPAPRAAAADARGAAVDAFTLSR